MIICHRCHLVSSQTRSFEGLSSASSRYIVCYQLVGCTALYSMFKVRKE